jgi:hypothetical protein
MVGRQAASFELVGDLYSLSFCRLRLITTRPDRTESCSSPSPILALSRARVRPFVARSSWVTSSTSTSVLLEAGP